ncbi:MAG: SHOCT domain-containing protein [Syntrophaceae bacterium]|nr:SHOCT domain-containing protein [Syntrophaceae bacterium]
MKKLRPIAVLPYLITTACYRTDYGHMREWDHMMSFGYGGMFTWIILIIMIGVLVYLLKAGKTNDQVSRTPLDILKERYAKGEISKEDFDRMKKDLEE